MRTILITGSEGIIGSVLRRGLGDKYRIRGVDLPDDISHYEVLRAQMAGVDTVIHLARRFSPADPIERRMRIYPENVQIDVNVFTAVVRAGVKRLIVASSVHADNHRDPAAVGPLSIPGSYRPATPYGVYKLIEEEVGKTLSKQFGFEFIGVRFGGVTRDDSVKTGAGQTATWLSHDDLLGAIDACLRVESVPGRSTIFYAVSNNADRIHDTTNPFGWSPKDNSADRI
ncbi:MAG TPA: NAD(P)-dependent oxidoreductase [Solirubrobacteraceae bacterium]|jgi:nucleoside-diphosphate-sugar epimerase|nr:NAD(P)-dependent oxidoreductase [Solirubrobacteraceae bacterium]